MKDKQYRVRRGAGGWEVAEYEPDSPLIGHPTPLEAIRYGLKSLELEMSIYMDELESTRQAYAGLLDLLIQQTEEEWKSEE